MGEKIYGWRRGPDGAALTALHLILDRVPETRHRDPEWLFL